MNARSASGCAEVLNVEHLGRRQLWINLPLELTGSAVAGLNIDHAEAVIDGDAAALVFR